MTADRRDCFIALCSIPGAKDKQFVIVMNHATFGVGWTDAKQGGLLPLSWNYGYSSGWDVVSLFVLCDEGRVDLMGSGHCLTYWGMLLMCENMRGNDFFVMIYQRYQPRATGSYGRLPTYSVFQATSAFSSFIQLGSVQTPRPYFVSAVITA